MMARSESAGYDSLTAAGELILRTASPAQKVDLTRSLVGSWRVGELPLGAARDVPTKPARPARPVLVNPGQTPKRSFTTREGRAAFIHAIAHIELNAVDLAWDIIARFADADMPRSFYDDWTDTAVDEADHFDLLNDRLNDLGYEYGSFPAHDGLWQAAHDTSDDLSARLALIPMVLEARGLDTAPMAEKKLIDAGDSKTAQIMARIAVEEVPHVAAGVKWFKYVCAASNRNPVAAFHDIVRTRFSAKLKPPFNVDARTAAGMEQVFYDPLAT